MKRPRLIANFAITADGKVSTRNFTPTGFTSPADKRRLLEIRALGDAVLVGARTLNVDRMAMRLPDLKLQRQRIARGQAPEPLRVIASKAGRALDPKLKVFRKGGAPVVVFAGSTLPAAKRAAFARRCDLWVFAAEEVPLEAMLQTLRRDYGVRTVVCEGGPALFRSLLEIGAVDELHLTWAPVVFGGAKAPTITGLPGDFLPQIMRGKLKAMQVVGEECFLTYRFTPRRR